MITTTPSVDVAAKFSLLQALMTSISKQERVTGAGIDDLPEAIKALTQWLVAYAESKGSLKFYAREDSLGGLLLMICINQDMRVQIEDEIGTLLSTSTVGDKENAEIYNSGDYTGMLQVIVDMFGDEASSFFVFDDPDVSFILSAS